MSQDEFTRLFKYMQEFRSEVSARFDAVESRFELQQQSTDAHIKDSETAKIELASISRQVTRLNKWSEKVAAKTGVSLEQSS